MTRTSAATAIALLATTIVCGQEAFRGLQGPYMGQEAGASPQFFLPGKIASGADESSVAFLPGARSFLWLTSRVGTDRVLVLEDRDGRWQAPTELGLPPQVGRVRDFSLGADGRELYLTADGPAGAIGGTRLWRVPLGAGGWGRPEPLGPGVDTEADEGHPSVARDGTLFFHRRDPEDPDRVDIYVAHPTASGFTVEKLPAPINSGYGDYDPFISPDGVRLVFCSRRPGGSGRGDIYVSSRTAGSWGEPVNLAVVNSAAEESTPSITLDGRYLFFASDRTAEVRLPPGVPPARSMPGNGSRDVYWVKVSTLIRRPRRSPPRPGRPPCFRGRRCSG